MKPASPPVPQFQRIHPGSELEWKEASAAAEQAGGTALTLADGVTPQGQLSHSMLTQPNTLLAPQKKEASPLT